MPSLVSNTKKKKLKKLYELVLIIMEVLVSKFWECFSGKSFEELSQGLELHSEKGKQGRNFHQNLPLPTSHDLEKLEQKTDIKWVLWKKNP